MKLWRPARPTQSRSSTSLLWLTSKRYPLPPSPRFSARASSVASIVTRLLRWTVIPPDCRCFIAPRPSAGTPEGTDLRGTRRTERAPSASGRLLGQVADDVDDHLHLAAVVEQRHLPVVPDLHHDQVRDH